VAVGILLTSAAACGDDDAASTTTAPAPTTVAAAEPVAAADPLDTSSRPVVSVPDQVPGELIVTEIVPGEGQGADNGDILVVDYVGARTINGQEFDNSWENDQQFMLVLGAGGVIAGWEEGLQGAREGSRIQIDIPASLAYGDESPGAPIQPGDALSFVIDVRAVVPAADPADAPAAEVPLSDGASELEVIDVVTGDGEALTEGSSGLVQLLVHRGDTGELLDSTWDGSGPVRVEMVEGLLVPGLYDGLLGARQGGRRIIVIPFAQAFGLDGNEDLGLPPATDVILVVDVQAVW
jgi:peptidylprolyl isomerase